MSTCYLNNQFSLSAAGDRSELIIAYENSRTAFVMSNAPEKSVRARPVASLPATDFEFDSNYWTASVFARLKATIVRLVKTIAKEERSLAFDSIAITTRALKTGGGQPAVSEFAEIMSGTSLITWFSEILKENGFLFPADHIVVLEMSCISGVSLLDYAHKRIRSGRCRRMLLLSWDVLFPLHLAVMDSLGVLSKGNPPEFPRVFHVERDGFFRGEAACAAVLSDRHERGEKMPIVLHGARTTCDASRVVAMDTDGSGLEKALRLLLAEAEVGPEKIDLIKVHGTGTQLNDVAEAAALAKVFNGRLPSLPVISFKSQFGHTLYASTLLELSVLESCLQAGCIMPVMNSRPLDPNLETKIPDRKVVQDFRFAIGLAMGFGGFNGAYLIEKVAT